MIIVLIKALRYGCEFAVAYEKMHVGQDGVKWEQDVLEFMKNEKKKKESEARSRYIPRFSPYPMGAEARENKPQHQKSCLCKSPRVAEEAIETANDWFF